MKRILVAFALVLALLSATLPAQTQPVSTRLGASLFWAMRGLQTYQVQLDQNLTWVSRNLGADFVRVLMVLGGDTFTAPDGNRYDPWLEAAIPPINVVFEGWVARTTDYIYDTYGLKVMWTIVGSDFHSVNRANLDTYADHFALQIRTREHKVELVEAWNEYGINGGDVSDLQYLGRRLRANLGAGFPIALSSPNGTHREVSEPTLRAEIGQMYAGADFGGANVFTYHSSRFTALWRPASILRLLGPVSRYNSEPRGPGASAGGDVSTPATLAQDYRDSINAREAAYVYHSMPGVWGGHCYGFQNQNRYRNLWEVPNASGIAEALRSLRRGQDGTPAPTPPPAPGPAPAPPVPPQPPPTDPIAVLMDLVRRVQVLEEIARRAGLLR